MVGLTLWRRTTQFCIVGFIGSIPERSIICVGQLWLFFFKPVGYFVHAFAVLIRVPMENLNLDLSLIAPGNHVGRTETPRTKLKLQALAFLIW